MPFQPFHPLKKNVPKLTRRKSKRSTGAYKVASRLARATPPPPPNRCDHYAKHNNQNKNQRRTEDFAPNVIAVLERMLSMLSLMTAAAQRSYMMYLKKLFEQGKFGAFFASIPLPIFAAAHCILFGLVGVTCIKCENPMDKELKIMVNDSSSEVTHRH
ncbi:Nucleobase-ascorbate transporter [Arachis hypogaea]|uniref:Nucleobase-ascorbate transporter n=1 Tax=Arachis hypogaea TaxID=3818 RepID=A0A6B9VA69_ARAHY|nr:Nucleobase-ascorbate transporter [Arachis hypogaea]